MLKIVILILVLAAGAFFLFKYVSTTQTKPSLSQTQKIDSPMSTLNPDEPPLKLKSIGVNFEDFKFTKEKLQFNRMFMDYGFNIPASPDNPGKANPQPTYILPLGTPVRSLVDGIVANIPTVWSGDYSIQVTKSGKLERWVYETEHVINPKVKVGDKVSAGDVIAEVGSFGGGDPPGYGAVEIGILHGGGEGPPEHVCPFAYLDESIKEDTFSQMKDLFKRWEEYIGDQSLYDESMPIPGCLTLDPIPG
jgi:hypothetical protein